MIKKINKIDPKTYIDGSRFNLLVDTVNQLIAKVNGMESVTSMFGEEIPKEATKEVVTEATPDKVEAEIEEVKVEVVTKIKNK